MSFIRANPLNPFDPCSHFSFVFQPKGEKDMLHGDTTDKVIHAFYRVYRSLGPGCAETAYESAMTAEMEKSGLKVEPKKGIRLHRASGAPTEVSADFFVDGKVIVELRAARAVSEDHETRLIDRLGNTDVEVGMLLNFGQRPEFRRKLFQNPLKHKQNAA
jgi:GxxExxY protein